MDNQKSNENEMVVYSFKIHTQLRIRGFRYITTLPNPKNSKYICWVYERTPAFIEAFNEIVNGR